MNCLSANSALFNVTTNLPLVVRSEARPYRLWPSPRGEAAFANEDVFQLQQAIDLIEDQVHEGVQPYRLAIKKAARTLNKASRADVLDLSDQDLQEFQEAHSYFVDLVGAHRTSNSGGNP